MKSEFELIDAFARRIHRARPRPRGVVVGVGDDAAVLRLAAREDLVVTTDALVEGVHFERRWLYGANLGRRLAAVNLSDIAAMGAEPRYAVVSFALPPGTPAGFVEDIERGAIATLARYGAHVVGGNLTATRGPLVCDMTLLGACRRGRAWPRRARARDVIVVAGELGAAAAGVTLLRAGKKDGALVAAYKRPVPRLDVARALTADRRLVRGAIDTSDGLSSDLIHLCEASGVGCEIDARAIPVARGVAAFCRARSLDPVEWALHAGEDYALILAVSRAHVDSVIRAIEGAGVRASVIGRFTKARGSYRVIDRAGRARVFRAGGWDHLRRRR